MLEEPEDFGEHPALLREDIDIGGHPIFNVDETDPGEANFFPDDFVGEYPIDMSGDDTDAEVDFVMGEVSSIAAMTMATSYKFKLLRFARAAFT